MKKIIMILERTNTGYSAYAEDYPIFTSAETMPELLNNAHEAIDLYYEDNPLNLYHVVFQIDFVQFFKYYKVLNAKFLAEKINMNPTLLSQYIRGHKKPSLKQTEKILNGIQKIGRELSEINFITNN
ncbi:MAG: helix-turn-helix transcriptional regulator [Candidatus Marinimicrobia bacterium]|nr:helix-turn-helix transcriptional regulator [Candidatus Neomarinimicrobiota bacterium]